MVGAKPAVVGRAFFPSPYFSQPVVDAENPPSGDCYLNSLELIWKVHRLFGLRNDMTSLTRPIKVFLIHTHADRKAVHGLYARLAKDGIKAWLDAKKLSPGQDWKREIRRAILMSDVVIVCLSKRFNVHKGYCQEELKIALRKSNMIPDGEVFIIPARLEKCDMLKPLRRLHRVDLFETDGYKKLIHCLRLYVRLR